MKGNQCSLFSRSQIRFVVCRCFLGCCGSSARIWSMNPSHGPSFGFATGFFRSYPGGIEYASILFTVCRDNPNCRAASRWLIPSTWTALLTRAYTSSLYTSQGAPEYNYPVLFENLKCGGLLFDRHDPSLTRRFVVHCCSAVYIRRPYGTFAAVSRRMA